MDLHGIYAIISYSSMFCVASKRKSDDHSNVTVMILPLVSIFWSFALIFTYCELSQMITTEFDMFNVELCEYKWYLCSIDMQRMLLIFMSNTQQPIALEGFGNIVCSRNSFINVIY